jgi:hypothetical protein
MAKIPKWREEWTRLVGDHQFLEIKNFHKYQALTTNGIPVAQWIKDFVEKDFEETDLTGLQRWLLDSLRRWRGRSGSNVHANLTAILSATCAHLTDRPHIPHAVCTLITRGFLIPSNQRDRILKKIKEDKTQEESSESSTSTSQDTLDNIPSDTQTKIKTLKCRNCEAQILKGWSKSTCPRCKKPLSLEDSPAHPAAQPTEIPSGAVRALASRLREVVKDPSWDVDEQDIEHLQKQGTHYLAALDWFLDENDAQRLQLHFPNWGTESKRQTIGSFADFIKHFPNVVSVWEKDREQPFENVEVPKSKAFEIED